MRTCTIARLNIRNPRRLYDPRTIAWWIEGRAADLETNSLDYNGWQARYFGNDVRCSTEAKLVVGAAGSLSLPTRRRIAKWLRSRAAYLRKHAGDVDG